MVMLNEVFLGNWSQQLIPEQAPYFRLFIYSCVVRIYLNDELFTSTASISCLVYPIASPHNTSYSSGILTGFPSTTAFALALGTD
jgi:hypothetical protein